MGAGRRPTPIGRQPAARFANHRSGRKLRLRTLTAAQPGLVGSAGGDTTATAGGDIGAYAGATTAADPIEELCAEDPAADECRVYED